MPVEERALTIPTPRVFLPLLQPSRYKGIFGGRGGAKSHEFADLLIDRCLTKAPTRAVCIREFQTSLEQSVKRLLEDKINKYKLGSEFRVTHTHIETPEDGIIIFQGMQKHTSESIKSLEGYDVGWVEEAQSLSQRSLDLLRPTIREEDSEIWFSWNPRYPTDPVDDFLRGNAPRKPEQPPWSLPPGAVVVKSNYRDNPFFPSVLRTEMEWDRKHDPEKYAHIWLGEYERNSEARVFKNFVIEDFETPEGVMFYYGADWGYSVDPSVLTRLWIDGKDLYIDQEAYKIGVEIDDLPAHFDQIEQARLWTIVADSARPETISYMKRHGFPRMEAAVKGPNSVKEGIIFLQGYRIHIHTRCRHTADEFTMYSYVRDKLTNAVTPILEDKKNHVIDSVRYAIEKIRHGGVFQVLKRG